MPKTRVFNWRDYAQDWDRLFTTERVNWLQNTGVGYREWAYVGFHALPRFIQEAFADHVKLEKRRANA